MHELKVNCTVFSSNATVFPVCFGIFLTRISVTISSRVVLLCNLQYCTL